MITGYRDGRGWTTTFDRRVDGTAHRQTRRYSRAAIEACGFAVDDDPNGIPDGWYASRIEIVMERQVDIRTQRELTIAGLR